MNIAEQSASDLLPRTSISYYLRVRIALISAGLISTVAQIVLLRELLVICEGNELSLGVSFASWLLWTAFGSWVLGRLRLLRNAASAFALLLAASPIAMAFSIALIHTIETFFRSAPGESIGPIAILVIAATSLVPFCTISGWLFTAGVAVVEENDGVLSVPGGTMYLLESIGAALGGAIAAVALLPSFSNFQIVIFLAFAAWLASAQTLDSPRIRTTAAIAALSVVLASLTVVGAVESYTASIRWTGPLVLGVESSRYGTLAVYGTGETRFVTQNGTTLFTVPDRASAEESVHFGLLEHPGPATVLLIGGGLSGAIDEIFRHPSVKHVDYVELDPALIGLASRYFPMEKQSITRLPEVTIHAMDGRLFLKNGSQRFDVIILNVPEPTTAQLNRYFTLEFYREIRNRLAPGGVLEFQVRSAEEYISPMLAAHLQCVRRTLGLVFPNVSPIPGEYAHFLASSDKPLATSPAIFAQRIRERQLQTQYVREYLLPFRMNSERMQEFDAATRPSSDTPVNSDFKPSAYFFDLLFWSAQYSPRSQHLLLGILSLPWGVVTLVFIAYPFLHLIVAPKDSRRQAVSVSVFCAGAATITSQVVLLLGFQAIYGHVYNGLAMLISGFMVGLASGSFAAIRRRTRPSIRSLTVLQCVIAVLPVILVVVMRATANSRYLWLSLLPLLFVLLAALAGGVGGMQFVTALALVRHQSRATGRLYACDLLGACFGSLAVSLYLLPVFGFVLAAMIVASLNVAPLLSFMFLVKDDSGE